MELSNWLHHHGIVDVRKKEVKQREKTRADNLAVLTTYLDRQKDAALHDHHANVARADCDELSAELKRRGIEHPISHIKMEPA